MALLWRALFFFQQGPLPFLVFHLLMLFGACWLLSCTRKQGGGPQWLWIFLPLLPQIYGNIGMIWKDIGLALALFLAFALYCAWLGSPRRIFLAGATVCVLYALLVRHNALTAILPPALVLWLWRYTRKHVVRALAATIVTGLFCILFPLGFNALVCQQLGPMPAKYTLIDEISVTSHFAKKNLFFENIRYSGLPLEELPALPVEKGWKFYNVNSNEKSLVPNLIHIMLHHPVPWMKAKLKLFAHFSSFPNLKKDAWAYYFKQGSPEQLRKSGLRNILMAIVNACMNNGFLRLFFLPIFWAPLGMVVFVAGFLRKDVEGLKMMLLTSSGLGYYAGFFIAIPTPDYRYFVWLNLSVISALLVWRYAPGRHLLRAKRQEAEAA